MQTVSVCKFWGISVSELRSRAKDFNDELLINYRHECSLIISRLSEDKLKAVYGELKVQNGLARENIGMESLKRKEPGTAPSKLEPMRQRHLDFPFEILSAQD